MLSARPAGRLRLAARFVVFATVVCVLLWISGFPRQYDDEELPQSQRPKAPSLAPHAVDSDQLVVSVKTTASDAWAALPPLLLLTHAKYHDNLLLMGDLHMDLGAFHVHDVLDRYSADFVAANDELQRYRRQLEFALTSTDFRKLKAHELHEEKEILARLDKYKVLRMLERAWETRPARRWYAFVEPDSYLVRSNLLSWLGQFDPAEPVFFANPPFAAWSSPFAMGGSTFILSEASMRALIVDRPDVIPHFDSRLTDHNSAYGVLTAVLSTALSLGPNKTWPGISGFNPATIPYGPGLWCEQIMAMQSMPTELASEVWRLERDREEYQHLKEPLLFADIWIRFMQPENLDDPREDWDNLSSGPEYGQWNILFDSVEHGSHHHRHSDAGGKAHDGEESWQACRDSCNESSLCVQWSYSTIPSPNHNENGNTKCHLSRSMRFGAQVDPKEVQTDGETELLRWTSGWRKDKFLTWARQQRCKSQQN